MMAFNDTKGIAIIYVTLFLMVLGLLFIAVGIDTGWVAYVRSRGQAATDAAALRGAAAIPNANQSTPPDPTLVRSMARGLNSSNVVLNNDAGIQDAEVELCTGTPDSPVCPSSLSPALGVRVSREYSAPLFLTRLFNSGSTTPIRVSSIAWLAGPTKLQPDLPVAVCSNEPPNGVGFDEKDPTKCLEDVNTDFTPNNDDNAGWWALTSPNSSQCRDWVNNPENIPEITIGQTIDLNNGEITSCLRDIAGNYPDPPCNEATCTTLPEDHADRQRCTAILPIVHCESSIGAPEKVLGFAALCITGVRATPASKAFIRGKLKCGIEVGGLGDGPPGWLNAKNPVLIK